MSNELVSIIIPTYNRAHLIGETLDSILAQTYTNWECIIVDDGSTDNTGQIVGEYVKKDCRFQYHSRPSNRLKGPNSCRNLGFELSKGDLIKWFDSDDLLINNALEKNINEFDSKIDVLISSLEFIDYSRNKIERKHNFFSKNVIEDYLVGKITFFVSPPTWSRMFLLSQSELFDEKIRNLDDWDFNLRMLYSNPNIRYIDLPLIQYRLHDTSLSREIGKVNLDEIRSAFYAREKHVKLLISNNKADFRILKNYILFRYKIIARKALLANSEHKYDLLLKLMGREIKSFDFIGLVKTILGSIVYIFFKRGVKLLK